MESCILQVSCKVSEAQRASLTLLFLHMRLGCGLMSITTSLLVQANEFDVRSVFHRHVSLVAVNQICVIHEAMNGCKI